MKGVASILSKAITGDDGSMRDVGFGSKKFNGSEIGREMFEIEMRDNAKNAIIAGRGANRKKLNFGRPAIDSAFGVVKNDFFQACKGEQAMCDSLSCLIGRILGRATCNRAEQSERVLHAGTNFIKCMMEISFCVEFGAYYRLEFFVLFKQIEQSLSKISTELG